MKAQAEAEALEWLAESRACAHCKLTRYGVELRDLDYDLDYTSVCCTVQI
jgi:hypothetical protein